MADTGCPQCDEVQKVTQGMCRKCQIEYWDHQISIGLREIERLKTEEKLKDDKKKNDA